MTLTEIDKSAIVAELNGLPPDSYKEHWEHIKQATIENNLPIPESPLLMLFQIFEDWYLDTFLILFPELKKGNSYSEFSPSKEHSQKREHDNLILIIKGIEPLGRDELRRIERDLKRRCNCIHRKPVPPMTQKFATSAETAQIFSISRSTLKKWRIGLNNTPACLMEGIH